MRRTPLKRTSRGYVRNLGRKGGSTSQEKFCLGFDNAEAERRLELIAELWRQFEDRGGVWDNSTLVAAKAIARGEQPDMEKRPYESAERYYERVKESNGTPANPFLHEAGKSDILTEIGRLQSLITTSAGKTLTGQKLHQAIDAYRQHVLQEYTDESGAITDNGKTKLDILKSLKSYLPDPDLGELDFTGCDQIAAIFRRRPVSKRYEKQMARKTCNNYTGGLKRCLT